MDRRSFYKTLAAIFTGSQIAPPAIADTVESELPPLYAVTYQTCGYPIGWKVVAEHIEEHRKLVQNMTSIQRQRQEEMSAQMFLTSFPASGSEPDLP